jgi:wyosine [tRNA(Phe)-imidazoG37] synthetase (radical SAM superfamily)
MLEDVKRIAFGPVPSRRLGQSIGINNIPPKICTYSCIYCQLGKTYTMQSNRQSFYKTKEILAAVKQKIQRAKEKKETTNYLTFVADGEPTIDSNLGEEIELLKPLGIKIAVITNSSLMWKKDVRDDLLKADWVSLKIDTVDQEIWQRINRPHKTLQLKEILKGISEFSCSFTGDLTTETMLLQSMNDQTKGLEKTADFIAGLSIKKSYLSIPIRPPAETWVKSADERAVTQAFQLFKEHGIECECLIGYEGNAFAFTGDIEEDLLSIMSVHPLREDGVKELLLKANAHWDVIETLLDQKKVIKTEYKNKKFYMRTLQKTKNNTTKDCVKTHDEKDCDSR